MCYHPPLACFYVGACREQLIDRHPPSVVTDVRHILYTCMVYYVGTLVQPQTAEKAFALLIRDRVSQLRGNEPCSVIAFKPDGDNPIGMGSAGEPGGVEAYSLMARESEAKIPGFRREISLQTCHKLAMRRPKEYTKLIKAPLLMVIPELDDISSIEE